MENASRALLMAASVLLAVMIISVGVALFKSFGNSGKEIVSEIERARIAEFNNQFLKYYEAYDKKAENAQTVGITAHDIVTMANLAKKNNEEYQVADQSGYNENTFYIQIDVKNIKNFEKQSEQKLIEFLQENNLSKFTAYNNLIKDFYVSRVDVSTVTGRVMHVVILEK